MRNPDSNLLEPDRDQLELFVDALFRHAGKQGFVAIRGFFEDEDKAFRLSTTSLADGLGFIIDVAEDDARRAAQFPRPVVFCPPIAIFGNKDHAREVDLIAGPVLSVELDQHPLQGLAKLESLLGPATVVVKSGGIWIDTSTGEIEDKLHAHWRLKKLARGDDLAKLKAARERATAIAGGDPSNVPISHPMRWPGSWHRKAKPRLCTIERIDADIEIDLDEALAILTAAAPAAGKAANDDDEFHDPGDGAVWDDLVASIVTGRSYHHSLVSLSARLVGAGLLDGQSVKLLRSIMQAATAPRDVRWQARFAEIPRIVSSAREKFGDGNRGNGAVDAVDLWAKFDPPALPRGLLPKVIEDFAFDRSAAMGCDLGSLAVCALVVCAAAIPDRIKLQPKKHDTLWLESARLWVAPVGSPSTMKSPMIAAAAKPLRRIDNEMARVNQDAMNEWHRLPKEVQRKTPQPRQPRLMIEDTTIEAAQEVLKDSPNGVLSYQDELSGWFGAMDKYSGGRGAAKDRGFWLQSFNGGSYSVNRIGRGSVFIENLSVSMLGGIQPELIRKLAEDGSDDGLLQRLIPIVLRPAVLGRDEPASDAASNYDDLINNLHKLKPPKMGLLFPADGVLTFDDRALKIREALEKKHLELQQCETINRKLASHIGKYNGIFARLCVVFHCIEHAEGGLPAIITEATAQCARGLLHGFLLPHALAFYAGVLGLSNDHDRLTAVAGYILAHKLEEITNRHIQRGDRTMRNLTKRETDSIFEQLDALGWVTRVSGRRPTDPPRWIVNPVVHQRFAERGKAEAERRERERVIVADLFRRSAE